MNTICWLRQELKKWHFPSVVCPELWIFIFLAQVSLSFLLAYFKGKTEREPKILRLVEYSCWRRSVTEDTLSLLQQQTAYNSDGEENHSEAEGGRGVVILQVPAAVSAVVPDEHQDEIQLSNNCNVTCNVLNFRVKGPQKRQSFLLTDINIQLRLMLTLVRLRTCPGTLSCTWHTSRTSRSQAPPPGDKF